MHPKKNTTTSSIGNKYCTMIKYHTINHYGSSVCYEVQVLRGIQNIFLPVAAVLHKKTELTFCRCPLKRFVISLFLIEPFSRRKASLFSLLLPSSFLHRYRWCIQLKKTTFNGCFFGVDCEIEHLKIHAWLNVQCKVKS